jgi:hypothetical protein
MYTTFYSANSKGRDSGVEWRILKTNLNEKGDRLDSIRSRWGSITDVYEYGNEPSGSMKGREIFDPLRHSQLLNKGSFSWSCFTQAYTSFICIFHIGYLRCFDKCYGFPVSVTSSLV